ncbi:MAG: type II toxin-antitoxin system HicA family toxin [Dehalococcoidales bacterium]|nr:type II toxin-antitoxin system HicA family toxin [Dehalococcoidales bacterium]
MVQYILSNGAYLVREGSRHSIYQRGRYRTIVPQHREIKDELARKIFKDLNLNIPFNR